MQAYPLSYLLLLTLAALAPVPFGCDTPEGIVFLAGGSLLALGLWAVDTRRGAVYPAVKWRYLYGLLACYGAVAAWGAWHATSVTEALRLPAYAGAFWLAVQLGRSEVRARKFLQVIVVASCAVAVYGLILRLTGSTYVLWVEKTHYTRALTGTFLSRNNAAVYLGIGILAASTLLLRQLLENTRGQHGSAFVRQVLDNMRGHALLCLLAIMLQGAAVVLTFSRSGMLGIGVGGATLALMLCMLRPFREQRFILLSLAIILGGSMLAWLAFSMKDGNSRWDSLENSLHERSLIVESVRPALEDHALTGYGLGSFEAAITPHIGPELQQLNIDRHDRMDHAHNSYMQLAVELGIPATFLLLLCPLMLTLRCLKGVLVRRFDGVYPALGVALTTMMAAQAMFDYAMEIPAITFTYALVMGLAWAQAFSSWEDMA